MLRRIKHHIFPFHRRRDHHHHSTVIHPFPSHPIKSSFGSQAKRKRMLHTEPSLSVYAADEYGLLETENKTGVSEEIGEFSFVKSDGFQAVGIHGDAEDPVFFKNHAHLLQSNGDLNGAEEYYLRATQADPKDGESLVQYAKLVWELRGDKDKALAYFKSAVEAAPQDWSGRLEEYYKRMVNEKCDDPLLLSNYARFLRQTKGDLEGAQRYYSRAVEADPGDAQLVSEYAQLVWELDRDQHKASTYFKRAVEAAPTNSHVLAAYAKFLWEAKDEDDEDP